MHIQKLFLTFLGTGAIPRYQTKVAALLATAIGIAILHTLGMETLFMLTFVLTVISIFEVNKYVAASPKAHYDEITIDDASGMWLSLMITLSTAMTTSIPYAEIIGTLLALASYLFFQYWKPSTIGWMYRELKGGLGIILSSVLSGIAGGLFGSVVLMGIERMF